MHQIKQKKPKPIKRKWINDKRRATTAPRDLIDRARRSRCSSVRCDRPTSSTIDDRDRAARRRGAIIGRAARSGLSLLSLSLFPEVIWSENEGRKSFPGQRWKYWSTGSHFSENIIFRDNQTCKKWWKWFPEIIFTQNKRTLCEKCFKICLHCIFNYNTFFILKGVNVTFD